MLIVILSAVAPYSHLGNFDIDFLVFCHRSQIMSLKFTVFERVWNSAVKFQMVQKQKREIIEVCKTEWNYLSLLLFFIVKV